MGSTTTSQPQRAHMRRELHRSEYRVSVPTRSTQLGPRRYLRGMQGGSYASRVRVGKADHAQKKNTKTTCGSRIPIRETQGGGYAMRAARESRNARRRLCAQIRERTRTKPFEPRSTALALRTLMTVPRIHNHPGSTRIGLRAASGHTGAEDTTPCPGHRAQPQRQAAYCRSCRSCRNARE